MSDNYDPKANGEGCYREAIAAKRAKLLMERIPTAKRVEVIGDCELILGDCQSVIPALEPIDAAITDPPYGIGEMVGGYGREGRTIANDEDLRAFVAALEALRLTQKNCWVAAFYSCRITDKVFADVPLQYFGEVIWDKKIPGMGRQIRYQHENIAFFKIGSPAGLLDSFSIIRHPRVGVLHPHEKPVGVMRDIIEMIPGYTILDPFMGSGTTGVACVKLGRRFIGIELDPGYFDIACERIRKAYAQPDLFVAPPPPTPVQEGFDL